MNSDQEQKHRNLISIIITVLFHAAIVGLLFAFSLSYLNPPPPEIGVEMSDEVLTEADMGAASGGMIGGGESDLDPTASDNDDNNSITQNESSPLTAKRKSATNKPTKTTEEPKVDETALFQKGKVKKGGSGKGIGGGDGDNQGVGSGTGNSGSGMGKDGTGFSLSGRDSKSLSRPKVENQTGKVVVEIKVDREGNVIEAHAGVRGTTLNNINVYRRCEQAAKRSKFSPKPDAPEIQRGTITYRFVN